MPFRRLSGTVGNLTLDCLILSRAVTVRMRFIIRYVTDAGASAWIHVFDVDAQSAAHPNPIVVRQTIITSAASIARYALEDAPNQAFSEDGSGGAVVAAIHRRLSAWWPELAA